MPYDPIKNYEVANIEEMPNGNIVTLANGNAVFVKKTGGRWLFKATFEGDFLAQSGLFYKVGDTFTHNGINFTVDGVSISGLHRILARDGTYFDGRHFTLSAMSSQAYDDPLAIHSILAGEA